MIKKIKHTKTFKQDLEKYKGNPQLKQLVEILKDLSNNKINFFLGPSSNNRKEYHMENGLLLIYRIDTDILYLERFGSHTELFKQ
jgi:mRNA interferase YafQ